MSSSTITVLADDRKQYLEQREPVAVGGRAEDADHERDDDRRACGTQAGWPSREGDDGPQHVPGLDHREQQHRHAERDAEAAHRMQPAAEYGQQQPRHQDRDDEHADRTGQAEHRGGVVAEPEQDADLSGAQGEQRRQRHPAAHDVGGAQGEDPAEPEAAGPADQRHHRQRHRGERSAGQYERLERAAPAACQRHRHEAEREQRRQFDLRGHRDQHDTEQQHRQWPPSRPVLAALRPRQRTREQWACRRRCLAARTRCPRASARASTPRCGCPRPDA